MAGTDDWSTDPDANTTISYNGTPLNIAELCDAANLNNMGRAIMALAKGKFNSQDTLITALQNAPAPTLGPILTAIAALTPAADQGMLFTGASAVATFPLSAFARTILDDTSGDAVRTTIGAVGVTARQLGNPGYIKFSLPGSGTLMLAWGTATANPNGYTNVNFATPFPTASFTVFSGGRADTGASDNDPFVQNSGKNNFTLFSARDESNSGFYIAVGY